MKCDKNEEGENCIYGLVEKPEGKRLLERPRCKWGDNIQMYLNVDSRRWASFVWFRIKETRRDRVNALMNLRSR
jgi:hypothetical protein